MSINCCGRSFTCCQLSCAVKLSDWNQLKVNITHGSRFGYWAPSTFRSSRQVSQFAREPHLADDLQQFCTNLEQRQSKSYKTSFGATKTMRGGNCGRGAGGAGFVRNSAKPQCQITRVGSTRRKWCSDGIRNAEGSLLRLSVCVSSCKNFWVTFVFISFFLRCFCFVGIRLLYLPALAGHCAYATWCYYQPHQRRRKVNAKCAKSINERQT